MHVTALPHRFGQHLPDCSLEPRMIVRDHEFDAGQASFAKTKEKLTRPQRGRVAGAGAGSHFLSPSRGLRERLKFCAEAKLGKLSDQAICFDYGWTAVEMTGPEIVVFNAVF